MSDFVGDLVGEYMIEINIERGKMTISIICPKI